MPIAVHKALALSPRPINYMCFSLSVKIHTIPLILVPFQGFSLIMCQGMFPLHIASGLLTRYTFIKVKSVSVIFCKVALLQCELLKVFGDQTRRQKSGGNDNCTF